MPDNTFVGINTSSASKFSISVGLAEHTDLGRPMDCELPKYYKVPFQTHGEFLRG